MPGSVPIVGEQNAEDSALLDLKLQTGIKVNYTDYQMTASAMVTERWGKGTWGKSSFKQYD